MYSLPALLILSMAWSVARGQFFYNYNQEQPVETPESEAYDPSQYKYNPPQAVEQHFIQSRQSPQDVQRTEPVSRRYQAQPAPAARYQAQPDPVVEDYQSERRQSFRAEQPPTQPVYAPEEQNNYKAPQQTDSQQSRRTSRRRHYRVRESFQEVTKPPRVYSPSVFENVGLGQAPQGVYVPEDSLLNSLRLDTPRRTRARQAGPVQQTSQLNPVDENSPSIQPVANDQPNDSPFFYQAPQQQQYRQNSFQPTSHNQQSQSTGQFFVQPPPQQHTAQPPQQAYQPTSQELQQSEEFLRQRRPSRVQYVQEQQPQVQAARPPRRQRQQSPAQRQSAPPPQAVYETPAEPIYNIDSNQVFQEDQPARRPPNRRSQEIPQQRQRTQSFRAEQPPPQPIYAPEEQSQYVLPQQTDNQQSRRTSSRRQYSVRENFQEVVKPPRVYSPSVFENIGLGQAPQGVYVPEDSFLNVLRLDTPTRTSVRHTSPVQYAPQLNPVESNPRQPSRQSPSRQVYQPTSQELQQNEEFLSQRRPSRVQYVEEQQPRVQAARPQRRQRQQSQVQRQRASPPQTAYETPVEPIYNTHSNQVFENDQPARRPPNRRSQEIPQQRQRTQVPRATADLETRQRTTHKDAKLAIAALPADTDGDEIPGQAGVDYPTLHVIPTTAFSCSEQPHNGYYADLETSCQVMHLCQAGGVQSSFLCPNGTIFSQEKFSCQWWYEVNCADSPRFYAINDNLYKVPVPESRSRD